MKTKQRPAPIYVRLNKPLLAEVRAIVDGVVIKSPGHAIAVLVSEALSRRAERGGKPTSNRG